MFWKRYASVQKMYTENGTFGEVWAYLDGYVKGRGLAGPRDSYFSQAIEKDPGYALAYVGLSDCYVVPANPQPPSEKMPKARAAAKRALELDETLAEAHTALARVLAVYDWDWPGAAKEFKRAIELNPHYAGTHQWYGGYLEMMGRPDESLAERKQALELDPLSLAINFELAMAFYYARDYDHAIQQFQKTLELDPNFPLVHAHLPAAYEQKGRYDEAIAGFQKGITLRGGTEWSFSMSGLGRLWCVRQES
jgi:tetratricopeptide (TPR) repeat protein